MDTFLIMANTNKEVSSTKRGLKEGFDRVTFIVRDEIAYKLNCIASLDDVYVKDIVNEVLGAYVLQWEKANNKIKYNKK